MNHKKEQAAQLSQREGGLIMTKSGRLELGHNILWTLQVYLQQLLHNRPAKQSNSVKKTQNKGYYAVQDHSRSSRSVSIESPYATSY